jgi:hypothetical protein
MSATTAAVGCLHPAWSGNEGRVIGSCSTSTPGVAAILSKVAARSSVSKDGPRISHAEPVAVEGKRGDGIHRAEVHRTQ